jgi:PAS domain S-box-containing protein
MIYELANGLILLGLLWILGLLFLVFHRLTYRFGLILPIFFLGALTAALQFRALGMFLLTLAPGVTLRLSAGSYILLPVIMLGLLVIYIVDGSTRARNTLIAILYVSLLIAIIQLIPSVYQKPPGLITFPEHSSGPPPRIPLSSAFTLLADMIVLVVVYQTLSNWRNRFPSRAASSIALLTALWCDAILFPTLAYFGAPEWFKQLPVNLVGKTIAGLALLPLAVFYLRRIVPGLPNSAATTPRPPFDIFATRLQLEALARHQYSLIDTTRQISKLILRCTNPQQLYEQACQILVSRRGYPLVWIGLFNEDHNAVEPVAHAGSQHSFLDYFTDQKRNLLFDLAPWTTAIYTAQAVLIKNLANDPDMSPWRKISLDHDLHALAIFPLRQAENVLGTLTVYTSDPGILDQEDETSHLQQVADDLAYAIFSLEARKQQTFLDSAAKTMRDGLIITNYKGNIIYANPVIAEMLGYNIDEMEDRNIFRLMTPEQFKIFRNEMLPKLETDGQFTAELEMTDRQGKTFFVSILVTAVRNPDGRPFNAIINVRNTTQRHMYEHRLLTLNRLTTELVQIRDAQELIDMILHAGQDLLQANASAIYLTDVNSQAIHEIYTCNICEEDLQRIRKSLSLLPGLQTVLGLKEYYIEDITQVGDERENLQFLGECGFQAIMTLPVLYQRQYMGLLGLYYDRPHKFDQSEKQLGLTVANNLAIVLQNAHLYQAEHSQRKLAEALAQASKVLNSSLDLEKVLDRILEQTMAVVPCRSVNLMLIEGQQASVLRQLYRSTSQETHSIDKGPSLPLDLPTLQHMFQSGDSMLIPDTALDPRWRSQGVTTWIRSYAAAPLQIRQEVIGFLNVNSDQPNFFGPETTQRLQAFASNAAAALHNARLYQDLQKYSIELEERVNARTSELSAAIDRIEAILASVPEAVYVLDQDGRLLEVNRAGEALLIQASQEKKDLFDPDLMIQLQLEPTPGEKTILEIQGRAYQALASPLPLPQKQMGLIVVFQDVTHFRDLDRMKTQFVSDVSHELRTPLTNLSLYLDLLALEPDERKRARYQATLRRETNRLTQLIEDLLMMSRLESKRVMVQMQEVDVNRLAENLVQDRIPMAEQRNLEMSYTNNPSLPLALADPRLLTQVLSNLLTNSLNYTPARGDIQLSTNYTRNEKGDWITITTQDTGVGISAEELPHIFERFYRGSASRTTGAPGTGLGLAISNEIIEQMGGYITVDSQPGRGSTFTVWLQAVL